MIREKPPAVSQVQPNLGWGEICVLCRNVYPDGRKYTHFPPDYPCGKLRFFASNWIGPDLVRYVDGTESCDSFQSNEETKDGRSCSHHEV